MWAAPALRIFPKGEEGEDGKQPLDQIQQPGGALCWLPQPLVGPGHPILNVASYCGDGLHCTIAFSVQGTVCRGAKRRVLVILPDFSFFPLSGDCTGVFSRGDSCLCFLAGDMEMIVFRGWLFIRKEREEKTLIAILSQWIGHRIDQNSSCSE